MEIEFNEDVVFVILIISIYMFSSILILFTVIFS